MRPLFKLLVFTFWFLMTFCLSSCCGPILTRPTVNATPLQELILPSDIERVSDVIDVDIFDNIEMDEFDTYLHGTWIVDGKMSEYVDIDVYLKLFPDISAAQSGFDNECNNWNERYESGGKGDNLYCISYQVQYRLPPDSFCKPSGNYYTNVVFRKGELIINVEEIAANENSMKLSEAIGYLTEEIKNHISKQP